MPGCASRTSGCGGAIQQTKVGQAISNASCEIVRVPTPVYMRLASTRLPRCAPEPFERSGRAQGPTHTCGRTKSVGLLGTVWIVRSASARRRRHGNVICSGLLDLGITGELKPLSPASRLTYDLTGRPCTLDIVASGVEVAQSVFLSGVPSTVASSLHPAAVSCSTSACPSAATGVVKPAWRVSPLDAATMAREVSAAISAVA
eukprot:scaffold14391_cov116-Isochrysis_galbana.AAC.7